MENPPAEGEWKNVSRLLEQELSLTLPENISFETLLNAVAGCIRPLMGENPGKFISLLYRLDISEQKVRALLGKDHGDSAQAIARLIIERQMEKEKTRRLFRSRGDIPEEERW